MSMGRIGSRRTRPNSPSLCRTGERSRPSPRARRLTPLLLAVTWMVSACAVGVPKGEYQAYRSVRVAAEPDQQLLRMRVYLDAYPEGAWAAEFERARRARESAFFEQARRDRQGLERYLTIYPDGAFVAQAQTRLAALTSLETAERDRQQQAEATAANERARAAELARTWATRFAAYWLGVFSELPAWGETLPELAASEPVFSQVFGRPPRPRCTAEECLKYYTAQYAVPWAAGGQLPRTLQLVVRLELARGRVKQVQLLWPGWGFSRWFEAERGKLVHDAVAADRKEALDWAFARVKGLLSDLGELKEVPPGPLPDVGLPAVGPSGELIVPSAADPSVVLLAPDQDQAPARAVVAASQAARGSAQGTDMFADPNIPQLVLEPIVVPAADRATPQVVAPAMRQAEPPGSVGTARITALPPAAEENPARGAGPAAASRVQRFRVADLEWTVFAIAGDAAAPAFDGILIRPR